MLRLPMTMIALAITTAIGISDASAAPLNGSAITAAAYESATIQQVGWGHGGYGGWRRAEATGATGITITITMGITMAGGDKVDS